jgi:hypothetical protein
MSKWTKRFVFALLIAVPTVGFAVTRYHHAAHKGCPLSSSCPHAKNH